MNPIQLLKARLAKEGDSVERRNIIEMIDFWQSKLDVQPVGIDHLLRK